MYAIARGSSKRIRLKICASVSHPPLFSENWCIYAIDRSCKLLKSKGSYRLRDRFCGEGKYLSF